MANIQEVNFFFFFLQRMTVKRIDPSGGLNRHGILSRVLKSRAGIL
jgi:hypothetical protein